MFPFPQSVGTRQALQYTLEAHCDILLRSSGGWGFGHSPDYSFTRLAFSFKFRAVLMAWKALEQERLLNRLNRNAFKPFRSH